MVVEVVSGPVVALVVRGSAWPAASCTRCSSTPASRRSSPCRRPACSLADSTTSGRPRSSSSLRWPRGRVAAWPRGCRWLRVREPEERLVTVLLALAVPRRLAGLQPKPASHGSSLRTNYSRRPAEPPALRGQRLPEDQSTGIENHPVCTTKVKAIVTGQPLSGGVQVGRELADHLVGR